MKLQNGYQIIYSIKDKNGVEHFYAGKGTKPSKKDDVMVMVASGKVVYGGKKDKEVVIADGVTTEELLNITANGEYNIANYQKVVVEVPGEEPAGSVTITSNGEHNVAGKATANVNVPIPAGYIQPEGSLNITANANNIDVTGKASVNVNVPIPAGYIIPSGTFSITDNGEYNIKDYNYVEVNIEQQPAELPVILDCSDNSYMTSHPYGTLLNLSYETDGSSIWFNDSGEISLSYLNEDCSNLYSILYDYLESHGLTSGDTLPVIITTDSVTCDFSIYVKANTWSYFTDKYDELDSAFNEIYYNFSHSIYDLCGHEIGRFEFYLDTGC